VSQQADRSTAKSALIGAAVVAASAGTLALVARSNATDYKGISTAGGAVFGAGAAGIGGAIVAATSSKWRKTGLATAIIGLGGIGTLFAGLAIRKALQSTVAITPLPAPPVTPPSPNPGGNIVWTQIPTASSLNPNIIYRLSDVETPTEQATPPSLADVQANLAKYGFEVDGVWSGTPPQGWPTSDLPSGQPRIYIEFWATQPGSQLPSGLTSASRLYVQQATA